MRTASRFSIKTRLMLLCLVPMLVIGWGTWNLFSQFQSQLSSYHVITEKITMLSHITNVTHLMYQTMIGRTNGDDIQPYLAQLDQELNAVNGLLDTQTYTGLIGNSGLLIKNNVAELKNLAREINSASASNMEDYGQWSFDLIYELLVEIQKRSNHQAPSEIHTLDVVYDDLSWFLYWMQREVWFIRGVSETGNFDQQQLGPEGSPHFSPKLCRTYRFEASYG